MLLKRNLMCYLSTVPGNCLVKYGQIWSGSNDKMWNMDRKGMQKIGPDFFLSKRKLDLKEGHAENWAWMGWPPQILSNRRSPTTIASDFSKP